MHIAKERLRYVTYYGDFGQKYLSLRVESYNLSFNIFSETKRLFSFLPLLHLMKIGVFKRALLNLTLGISGLRMKLEPSK